MSRYDVPAAPVEYEWNVKQSRFIAVVERVDSLSAQQVFLQQTKQRYPQASHYCLAAVRHRPENGQGYAMSDDGEPSGTAGRPMLNVLLSANLAEVCVIVVRYFGGTKLGTGGLQRAYAQAVIGALDALPRKQVIERKAYRLAFDYSDQAAVDYIIAQQQLPIEASDYGSQVCLTVALEADQVTVVNEGLLAQTQGRVKLSDAK